MEEDELAAVERERGEVGRRRLDERIGGVEGSLSTSISVAVV